MGDPPAWHPSLAQQTWKSVSEGPTGAAEAQALSGLHWTRLSYRLASLRITIGGVPRKARPLFSWGGSQIEPRRQLLAAGRPVALGRKALDLLSVLAEADGDLVTKEELMAAWPGVVVEENAIQVHISAVRRALGEEATRLVTVRAEAIAWKARSRPNPRRSPGTKPRSQCSPSRT